MSAPPVEGTPVVVYVGPDSDSVETRWAEGSDRPFALQAVDVDEVGDDLADALESRRVDCVVVRADAGVDDAVDSVRRTSPDVPLVAFSDGLDLATAVDLDVTHCFPIDESVDATDRLERLGPLVDRSRSDRRERSMLDSLLANIPLSVYFKDRQSRHVRVSERQTTLTGDYIENDEGKRLLTADDVVGKTEFGLYDQENAAESVAVDEDIMADEEPFHEIEHIDGGPLDGTFVSTFKAPWYDGDEVVGTLGVTTDVTERKQYEHQLERQNERLERFANVISHDLRNPLDVAFGRLEFAQETGDPEHFAAVERALDRMEALIADVLTLARQGETVENPEPVRLADAARTSWGLVETDEATLAVETSARVLADHGRLKQLFENLFRNAIEHGGPAVTVTVGDLSDREGFFVADDGAGIPDDYRDDVFDSGFTTGDDGTGLGLSIVRTIAEAHGWTVAAAESAAGGARFEFAQVQRPD